MGGDLFRALLAEILSREASLDPLCASLLKGPGQELSDVL
jgi:hypothetical protein